ILPSDPEIETAVQQRQNTAEDRTDRWLQVMSPAGEEGLDLSQDARVFVSRLTSEGALRHEFGEGRGGYLYVIEGDAALGEERHGTGDAVKVCGPEVVELGSAGTAEVILIDAALECTPVGVWAR